MVQDAVSLMMRSINWVKKDFFISTKFTEISSLGKENYLLQIMYLLKHAKFMNKNMFGKTI